MKIYRLKLTTPVGLSDDKLIKFIRQLNLSWDSCCVHAECYIESELVRCHGRFAYYRAAKYIQIPYFAKMYVRDIAMYERNMIGTDLRVMYFDEFHSRWARLEIYPAGVDVGGLHYKCIGEI